MQSFHDRIFRTHRDAGTGPAPDDAEAQRVLQLKSLVQAPSGPCFLRGGFEDSLDAESAKIR